ncbi:hypothetical protein SUGI_0622590 [Cryptomeria japonica]|uniref:inorganic phosphate transporter 2-1, chloroplastic n=1 Tax=Cryptomeria japonica TaxID=3369 RepID=UPI002414CFAC|nr:inorganic phosphate transporter 2-1, chloroplastic [Cryptomeria japonica]GLJ31102.1 hypothetical protein SUGI_0622590 [Cryptomeria japonica]
MTRLAWNLQLKGRKNMLTFVHYCPGKATAAVRSLPINSYNPLGIVKPNGKSQMAFAGYEISLSHSKGNSNSSCLNRNKTSITPFYLLPILNGHKNLRATLSSFAEGDNIDENVKDEILHEQGSENNDNEGAKNGLLQGMAEAFNISPETAYGITGGIVLIALFFPVCMQPVTAANPLKFKLLSYLILLCGFYMAWNIGANDVANAMGTSVGSGALTLRQAVVTAAVLEFSGALLVGSHVTHTMQNGILTPGAFNGRDALLFSGFFSSLAAAGTWLQVASYYGLPVSTTHCIIGAMVGFGLVYGGASAVRWWSLARVVSSWIISPLLGSAGAFIIYMCIRRFVYSAPNPAQAAVKAAPTIVFLGVTALSLTCFPSDLGAIFRFAAALALGALGALLVYFTIQRQLGQLIGEYCEIPAASNSSDKKLSPFNLLAKVGGPSGTQLRIVYAVFGYMQILSACFMSFAHGANDVANAIGPISSALAILPGQVLRNDSTVSVTILLWGGFGIVAGLLIWGYRVIGTIGKKITELTPTRGFAAEFAAATVVTVASRFGLPISATHTLVGAVMGVGFARGLKNVDSEIVKEIVASWVVTIPLGALLSIAYTFILSRVLPALW